MRQAATSTGSRVRGRESARAGASWSCRGRQPARSAHQTPAAAAAATCTRRRLDLAASPPVAWTRRGGSAHHARSRPRVAGERGAQRRGAARASAPPDGRSSAARAARARSPAAPGQPAKSRSMPRQRHARAGVVAGAAQRALELRHRALGRRAAAARAAALEEQRRPRARRRRDRAPPRSSQPRPAVAGDRPPARGSLAMSPPRLGTPGAAPPGVRPGAAASPGWLRGRRGGRRRVARDPAVAREPHLDPRVGVEVAHDVLVLVVVERARGEAGRDARRDAAHPQQQRLGAARTAGRSRSWRRTGSRPACRPRRGGVSE